MAVVSQLVMWLAVAVAIAPASAGAREAGMQPSRTTADALSSALQPRRLAVVVGVDGYLDPAIPPLRHATADAHAIADQLASPTGGGFDRVIRLTEPGDVTRDRILAELKVLGTSARREDVVVVYFSGHGTLVRRDSGDLSPFLLVHDSRTGDLETSALDLGALRRFFSSMPARRKALIVDACFNGEGKSAVGPSVAEATAQLAADTPFTDLDGLGSGEALLFATTLGRPAREDDELGHGTYTWFLLQALSWETRAADVNGDGLVTAYEAHDWARGQVYERTGGVQLPEAAFRVVGVHDVVLSGRPDQRRDSDLALVFAYLPGDHPYRGASLEVDGRDKGLFPGTVALEPGRHRFVVRDAGGGVVFEGSTTVGPGQSVALDELRALVREDRRQLGVYMGYLGGATRAWRPLWGDGMMAVEVWSATRRGAPPARGLYIGGVLGAGFSPARGVETDNLPDTRTVFWVGPEVGWGRDLRRLRIRVGAQFRATLLPVDRLSNSQYQPAATLESGWLFVSVGPQVRVGYVVTDRISLVFGAVAQVTPLALDRSDPVSARFFGGFSAGVEVGL